MVVADSVSHITQHLQHQALSSISVAKVCRLLCIQVNEGIVFCCFICISCQMCYFYSAVSIAFCNVYS
jgi:hypothetical protein